MRGFLMALCCGVAMASLTACMTQPEPTVAYRSTGTTVTKAAVQTPAAKKKRRLVPGSSDGSSGQEVAGAAGPSGSGAEGPSDSGAEGPSGGGTDGGGTDGDGGGTDGDGGGTDGDGGGTDGDGGGTDGDGEGPGGGGWN